MTELRDAVLAAQLIPAQAACEAFLREELQTLFCRLQYRRTHCGNAAQRSELDALLQICRLKLRALQNALDAAAPPQTTACHDLAALLEDLCCAASILLRRKQLLLLADDVPLHARFHAQTLLRCLCNLLANALLHGKGDMVFVLLRPAQTQVLVSVVSGGSCPAAQFAAHCARHGSGLCAAEALARANGGRLLTHNSAAGDAHFTLSLPRSFSVDPSAAKVPDFTDLLCDRLSVLAVGLCGVV